MKHITNLTLPLWLVCVGTLCDAGDKPSVALPRSSPEAQGIASSAVLEFIEAADAIDSLHSFMLVRHGHVVAKGWWSPYNAESPHELYSLSKSFTSTAVGLAVAEGKLSVDDEVLKFFPDDAPAEPSNNLKAMRVRDLLCMSTGQQKEARAFPGAELSTTAFLAEPVTFKPGTHFLYNTPATYMLSAMVQKATGRTVLEYLRPRLFDPLGIDNPIWGTSKQGITIGGYGLSVRTEDIARFGQLYLQKGQWNGKQLVPAVWIEAATSRQTSNGSNPNSDWDQGYGYQFWRSRHGAYRGDGAFGQYCLVMPQQEAVVAITSGLRDMQAVMNLVWDRLLPAMKDQRLPEDEPGRQKLESRLADLKLRLQAGSPSSPIATKVGGKRFGFAPNDQNVETVALEAGPEGGALTLVVRSNGLDQRIPCGYGEWKKGRLTLGSAPERAVAASAAWTAEDTFTARLCFYETPFVTTLTLRFADDRLLYDAETNVGFGPTKQPQLVGTLATGR